MNLDLAHIPHNMCNMKNLTLRIEEGLLNKARQVASEQSTSVNALVREFLNDLVRQKSRSGNRP